ncbi:MAG: RES family NAD+ phosphorylase [Actinobacteria bacterium]|nr:RES family NAD+ phosphorylase [Actinomycetota bacterium]
MREVESPAQGIWRIGKRPDPLEVAPPLSAGDLSSARTGNRFDSPTGTYGVLYFGSNLMGCFGEILGRLRPEAAVVELIKGDWAGKGFMDPGGIAADWRHRREAIRVTVTGSRPFLDVESAATHRELFKALAPALLALGHEDLDVSVVRGRDRRVTRLISGWAFEQLDEDGGRRFAGLRYVSRISSDWECWCVFPDCGLEVVERMPIRLDAPGLKDAATLLGLRVF